MKVIYKFTGIQRWWSKKTSLAIKAGNMDPLIIMEHDYMDFGGNFIVSAVCLCHIQMRYSLPF